MNRYKGHGGGVLSLLTYEGCGGKGVVTHDARVSEGRWRSCLQRSRIVTPGLALCNTGSSTREVWCGASSTAFQCSFQKPAMM